MYDPRYMPPFSLACIGKCIDLPKAGRFNLKTAMQFIFSALTNVHLMAEGVSYLYPKPQNLLS